MKNGKTARLSALLLFVSAAVILLLTFQPPSETRALSHPVWDWFRRHGFTGTEHELRSLAHIPLYFVFGCALTFFGTRRDWSWMRILGWGAVFGLADELLKIALPTREFDFGDWMLDIFGIALALIIISLFHRGRQDSA